MVTPCQGQLGLQRMLNREVTMHRNTQYHEKLAYYTPCKAYKKIQWRKHKHDQRLRNANKMIHVYFSVFFLVLQSLWVVKVLFSLLLIVAYHYWVHHIHKIQWVALWGLWNEHNDFSRSKLREGVSCRV